MNYEDFASRNLEYYMDMVRLVEIKQVSNDTY